MEKKKMVAITPLREAGKICRAQKKRREKRKAYKESEAKKGNIPENPKLKRR